MSSIKETLNELYLINEDIRQLNIQKKELERHKKNCEKNVLDYLKENDLPGISYKNLTILLKEINRRKPNRLKTLQNILLQHGISDTELLKELSVSDRKMGLAYKYK